MTTVTVVTDDTVLADGLFTALFVMQPDEVLDLVQSLPDVSVVLVTAEGRVMYCSGMRDRIELEGETLE